MVIDFLAQISANKDYAISSFLCSINSKVESIKKEIASGRKLVLFALSKAPNALMALGSVGLIPTVFCNSDPDIVGRGLLGRTIISTWDILKNPDSYYIIIPETSEQTRLSIVHQLQINGIDKFSLIHETEWPDFDGQKPHGHKQRATMLATINRMSQFYLEGNQLVSPLFWHRINGIGWWNVILDWFDEEFLNKQSLSLLDIGPGCGLFSGYAKESTQVNIDWIDIDPEALQLKGLADQTFLINVETDEMPTRKKYDIIVMTEVVEHFNYKPVPTLKKIKSYLKPEGTFFISCPHWQRGGAYSSWREMPMPGTPLPLMHHGHIYEYSHEELCEICEEAGFEIVKQGFAIQGNSNIMLRQTRKDVSQ